VPVYTSYNILGSSVEASEITDATITNAKLNTNVGSRYKIYFPTQYDSVTAGTWTLSRDENYHYDQVMNSNGADSEEIVYKIWLPKGNTTFYIYLKKGTNGGILEVLLDTTSQGTIDCYNGSATYNNRESVSLTVSEAGQYDLKLKCNGKNASSSGYQLSLGYFFITDT
jgi:hypothetical protein